MNLSSRQSESGGYADYRISGVVSEALHTVPIGKLVRIEGKITYRNRRLGTLVRITPVS